jgi:hypothetical protein
MHSCRMDWTMEVCMYVCVSVCSRGQGSEREGGMAGQSCFAEHSPILLCLVVLLSCCGRCIRSLG